jgi:tetratricopeptide (TPR) repeat protein
MSRCIACCETIREGARLCPRCGTTQNPTKSRWKTFGDAVKWAGGAVTVISLSMGVLTLSGIYRQWQEKREAVAEHVDAASWLLETENYPQAWQMLDEALELSPSAPDVRRGQFDLALVWLRDFSSEKESAGETLDRLTAVLYRNLAHADDDDAATILAHVAWAQIVRMRFDLPVFADVDAVFDRALAASAENGYANAFLGYWRLLARGIGPGEVRVAQEHFRTALESGRVRELVRRLQLGQLTYLSFGRSDELENAVLAELLRTSFEMMQASEPKPPEDIRYKILDGYGTTGRGEHIEGLVPALPPDDHLAVHAWLREGLKYDGRPRLLTQMSYLEARLLEARGDADEALDRYRALLAAEHSTDPLDELVNASIERITGELPERALARKYIRDPVDTSDPWGFHVGTLMNFDPTYQPPNFDEALEFLSVAVATKDRRIPDLLPVLEEAEARVRDVVAEGDERSRLDAYTMNYTAGHHELARANLVRLSVLRGKSFAASHDLDAAVASLSDAAKVAEESEPESTSLRALAGYELASAYAQRAAVTADPTDRARALERLRSAVDDGAIDHAVTTWDDIKGDAFRALAEEPGYRELIRGR